MAGPGLGEVAQVLPLTEERGRLLEKQDALLEQMRDKFGEVPDDVEALVRGMRTTEELRPYVHRILRANSLEEMGFPPPNGRAA